MKQRSITSYQAFTMILMTVLGMSVLVFPRNMGEVAGRDGIWVTLIMIVLISIIVYLMTLLGQWYPGDSYVEYTAKILGSKRFPLLGKILHIPFLIFFGVIWLFLVAYVLRAFGEVVVSTILPRTPLEIIMIIFLLTGAVVASFPSEVIVKFNELLFPLIIIPFIFIVIGVVQNGELINFFPLFQIDWRAILQKTSNLFGDFAGYSIILILMAHYQQPEKAVRSHLLGFIVAGLIFWGVFAASLGVFGINEMNRLTAPTFETVRLISLPFLIFERLESVTIALWMVASFTTLSNIMFALVDLVYRKGNIHPNNRKWIAFLFVPLIFCLAMIPRNLSQLFQLSNLAGKFVFVIDVTVPLFLVIVAWVRKKRGKNHETSNSF